MSIHVLIVGSPAENAEEIVSAAAVAKSRPGFVVERCGPPAELWARLRGIVLREYAKIDVLDIFDHAAPGVQNLSGERLFAHDHAPGFELARKISVLLMPDARVRLLGCEVARGEHGKKLLVDLRRELGGSVAVYGALERTRGDVDFSHEGFLRLSDEIKLYSSTEASALPANEVPAVENHNAAMTAFLKRIRETDP